MRYLIFVSLFLSITSCIEVIEPELNEAEPRVVIEGLVTNLPGPYYVKVSKTNSFYSVENPPVVSGAIVIISDSKGSIDTLTYDPITGRYLTNKLIGETGLVYTLRVLYEGREYTSSSPMLPVTKIDSVYYNYYPTSDFLHEHGYYLAFMAKEPQETKDYYLWKFYKNGVLLHHANDINIASDEAVKEDIVGIEAPYVVQLGDTAKVEMYSLTREAFNFYSGLNNNINNDGGFFSSPPANPPSNITNGALGLFQVSSVEVSSLVIK